MCLFRWVFAPLRVQRWVHRRQHSQPHRNLIHALRSHPPPKTDIVPVTQSHVVLYVRICGSVRVCWRLLHPIHRRLSAGMCLCLCVCVGVFSYVHVRALLVPRSSSVVLLTHCPASQSEVDEISPACFNLTQWAKWWKAKGNKVPKSYVSGHHP